MSRFIKILCLLSIFTPLAVVSGTNSTANSSGSENGYYTYYENYINDTSERAKECYEAMVRKIHASMKYQSSMDYRTHYINNSLAVYDDPVIISHYYVSDFYFDGITIPFIFEMSKVQFVTPDNSTISGIKRNTEETDFAILADFGRYWNPTEGFFSYGFGLLTCTFPDSNMFDYDYGAVAYAKMNDGYANPFIKNVFHMSGEQKNCFEFVAGVANEYRDKSSWRTGYEAVVYYRRYDSQDKGFTNADLLWYVGYGKFAFKVRWVPFLDSDVLVSRFGESWSKCENNTFEFFLSYETSF